MNDFVPPGLPVEFAMAIDQHREKDVGIAHANHVCVAENVNIVEAMKFPAARAAVQAEWDKLTKRQCWLLESVAEYEDVKTDAIRNKKTVLFGRIDPRCTQKHSVLDVEHHKFKGRAVFRGDSVRDQDDNFAVFAENFSLTDRRYCWPNGRPWL